MSPEGSPDAGARGRSRRSVPDASALLDRALTEYLEAKERAEPISRDELRARYPAISEELDNYFRDEDVVSPIVQAMGRRVTPAPSESPLPVSRITGYEILGEVARGGMGVVYEAREGATGRVVALKVIRPGRLASDEHVQRFRREARAAANLEHPHIVPVYDVGYVDGVHYYTMPLLRAGSLEDARDRLRGDPLEVARLLETVASAVQFAHERGVLHRDLKPANVLLDEQGRPLVGDFGLAAFVDDESALTRTGEALGSPSHMAPEQAEGRLRDVSTRSDVYALGAILYDLLSGTPPFSGASTVETLWRVVHEPPMPLRRRAADAPRDLETIAMRCLEKDPEHRYASAADVADELARHRRGERIHARTATVFERVAGWARRNAVALAIWGVLLAAAIVATTFAWLWKMESDDARELTRAGYLSQARLRRASHTSGQRFQGLRDTVAAARIRPGFDAVNEALACLALPDFELETESRAGAGVDVVAFDPDHEIVAAAREDGAVTLRSLGGDASARPPITLVGGDPPVAALWVSSGGRFVAALHKRETYCSFRLWRVASGEVVSEVAAGVPLSGVAFDRAGARCLVTPRAGPVACFDLAGKVRRREWPGPPSPITICCSRDGRLAAISSDAAVPIVEIREIEDGRLAGSFQPGFVVLDLEWLPGDEQLVLVGDGQRDVLVVDARTGGVLRRLQGHENGIPAVELSPDGRVIASRGWDGLLKLWSARTGRELLSASTLGTTTLRFSRRGDWLGWTSVGGALRRLRFASGEEAQALPESAFQADMTFHPRLPLLVSCGPAGVAFHDPREGRRLGVLPIGKTLGVRFSLQGDELATWGDIGAFRWRVEVTRRDDEDVVVISSPRGWNRPRGVQVGNGDLDTRWRCFALDLGGAVAIVDPAATLEQRKMVPHHNTLHVAVSPEGDRVAAGALNGRDVRVWDASSGEVLWTVAARDANILFGGGGRWLVVGTNGRIVVRDTTDWSETAAITLPFAVLPQLATTPDGRWLVVAGQGQEIRLLDLPGLRAVATLALPQTSAPSGLRFSRDERFLAVATAKLGVVLFDLHRLDAGLTERGLASPFEGRTSRIDHDGGRPLRVELRWPPK